MPYFIFFFPEKIDGKAECIVTYKEMKIATHLQLVGIFQMILDNLLARMSHKSFNIKDFQFSIPLNIIISQNFPKKITNNKVYV